MKAEFKTWKGVSWNGKSFVDVFGEPISVGDICFYSSSTTFHFFVVDKIGINRLGNVVNYKASWPYRDKIKSKRVTAGQQELMIVNLVKFLRSTPAESTYTDSWHEKMLELRNEILNRK